MNKSNLKEFVKRTLEAMEDLTNIKKKQSGVSPDKLKHSGCPKCKNPMTTLNSTKPPMWGCDKCKHTWKEAVNENDEPIKRAYSKYKAVCRKSPWKFDEKNIASFGVFKKHYLSKKDKVNEEHGDVHYWGAQPKDKNSSISTGYKGTDPIKTPVTEAGQPKMSPMDFEIKRREIENILNKGGRRNAVVDFFDQKEIIDLTGDTDKDGAIVIQPNKALDIYRGGIFIYPTHYEILLKLVDGKKIDLRKVTDWDQVKKTIRGYSGLNESINNKALHRLVIEAAKEVVAESRNRKK